MCRQGPDGIVDAQGIGFKLPQKTLCHVPHTAGAAQAFRDDVARGRARPGMLYEYSMSAKWLELLGIIQAMAPALKVEVKPVNLSDAGEIERAVATFARTPNGGLIMTASAAAIRYRELVITLAARHKLPAVYWERFFVAAGGLVSYGPDFLDQFRRAAGYGDRILKAEKPA